MYRRRCVERFIFWRISYVSCLREKIIYFYIFIHVSSLFKTDLRNIRDGGRYGVNPYVRTGRFLIKVNKKPSKKNLRIFIIPLIVICQKFSSFISHEFAVWSAATISHKRVGKNLANVPPRDTCSKWIQLPTFVIFFNSLTCSF